MTHTHTTKKLTTKKAVVKTKEPKAPKIKAVKELNIPELHFKIMSEVNNRPWRVAVNKMNEPKHYYQSHVVYGVTDEKKEAVARLVNGDIKNSKGGFSIVKDGVALFRYVASSKTAVLAIDFEKGL